jgi:hypothetical protein
MKRGHTLLRQKFSNIDLLEVDLLDPIQVEDALLGLSELKARIEFAVKEGK